MQHKKLRKNKMNAIEQLKSVLCGPDGQCCITGADEDRLIIDRALAALAHLVQLEQEPVAWRYPRAYGHWGVRYWLNRPSEGHRVGEEPLYTSPPQREWVGLTGKETDECEESLGHAVSSQVFDVIEDKLKKKNI
jgi:hypothetical protein